MVSCTPSRIALLARNSFENLTPSLLVVPGTHTYVSSVLSLIVRIRLCFPGKQVVREDMKDEIIFKVNRFNANMLMNLEVDGDANYEETDQQKKPSSKNSQSHSSISTSNEQVHIHYGGQRKK